jgi:hypothetical protein
MAVEHRSTLTPARLHFLAPQLLQLLTVTPQKFLALLALTGYELARHVPRIVEVVAVVVFGYATVVQHFNPPSADE